jgi:hypothetical protein
MHFCERFYNLHPKAPKDSSAFNPFLPVFVYFLKRAGCSDLGIPLPSSLTIIAFSEQDKVEVLSTNVFIALISDVFAILFLVDEFLFRLSMILTRTCLQQPLLIEYNFAKELFRHDCSR